MEDSVSDYRKHNSEKMLFGIPLHRYITGYFFTSELMFFIGVRGQSRDDIHRLHYDLFSNYSTKVRPVFNQSDTVVININMYLMNIHELDEKDQQLSFSAWIYMEWYDEFLQWDDSDYNGISTILVPPTDVWRPDIAISNSYERMTKYTAGEYLIRVDSNGLVDWSPGDIFRTHCTVDITYYPFDTQTCNITLGTWMHDVSEVDVFPQGNISLADYQASGEWDVISTIAHREEDSFECCPDETTISVSFSITMARRKTFYILTVIIPVLLFSFLNVVDFVLPPESGEKMSLSVTVFLSFAFFMSILNESMPRTSLSFSILGIYMIVVMAMGTMSVLMSAIVIMLHHRARERMALGYSTQPHRQSHTVQRKHQDRPDFLPGIENFETLSEKIDSLYYDVDLSDDLSVNGINLDNLRLKDTSSSKSSKSQTETDLFHLAHRCDRFLLWFSLGLTVSGATVVISLLTYH